MTFAYRFLTILLTISLAPILSAQEEVHPAQIKFRRQAVTRMVFDSSQAIPLNSLRPSKIIELDLMHPELIPSSDLQWKLKNGHLVGTSPKSAGQSLRWVGGFNPFATYDLVVGQTKGSGSTGITFLDAKKGDSLAAALHFEEGKPKSIHWTVIIDGKQVAEKSWPVPADTPRENLTLRLQMAAVGVNILLESSGSSTLIGYPDFSKHLDLREREKIRAFNFGIATNLEPGARVHLKNALAALTPGSGQADLRAITDEAGTPLLDNGRLWFTITVRGRALPHPLQGVFSLNPSVFDIRFEGIIVFDMEDGLLRNELASHLFRDTKSGEWRGWTTGFSALGGSGRGDSKTILAVSSTRDPRKGFSIMKAKAIGIEGAHEDPHGVYDKASGKWRLIICEHHKKYQAGMWESDHWDRDFKRLAGPVEMDSTGTMIQTFGSKRFALYGSADRKIYIRSYPDLKPAGELDIEMPPWDDDHGTRIWPNVIPLPEGYPAPYIALMMDRVNFPNMPKRNWTYGAMYLYHGFPSKN